MALLDISDLQVHYRAVVPIRAVDGASFAVEEGSVVGLVGESGCGKTTAIRAVMRVLPPAARIAAGRMVFAGTDLATLDEATMNRRRWREIAFVPQTAMNALDPVYRVGAQLMEVLCERGGLGASAARARSAELFSLVGLNVKRLGEYPHQFSGGMRQRASIALALALGPKLILADEPVTALDVVVQRQILDTIRDLRARLGLSMVLVTHDVSVVSYVCDHVVVMYAGQVVEGGPAAAVLGSPAHPYTMGLYNAFPDLHRAGGELSPIEGSPPDLAHPPVGCRFSPRCPFVQPRCAAPPPMISLADNHAAACWRAEEGARLRSLAMEPATWRQEDA